LLQGGFLKEAGDIAKQRRDNAKTDADTAETKAKTEKSMLEQRIVKGDRLANMFRLAKDQQSWDTIRGLLPQVDPNISEEALARLPQQFDPMFINMSLERMVPQLDAMKEQRQADNELISRGPDGQPRIQPLPLEARRQVAAAGVQQTPVQIVQTASGPGMVPSRVAAGARSVDVIPLNDPTQRAPGQAAPRAQMAPPGGNKLPAEIQRMNIAADTMTKLLNDYEGLVRQNNPRDPTVQGSPALRADMQSLMKNIQLQFKELQALGALSGPDLAIMEAALTDPFTFRGAIYGQEGLLNQIRRSRELISARRQATTDNTKAAANRPAAAQPGQAEPSVNDLLRQYAK
jgi:hypothetical protein